MDDIVVKAAWFDFISGRLLETHKLGAALMQAQKEIAALKEPSKQATEDAANAAAARMAELRAAVKPAEQSESA